MATIGGGAIKSYEFTKAWSVNPASASGKVVINDPESFELTEGDYIVYQFSTIAVFYGIVSEIVGEEAVGSGTVVSFRVLDNRIRLKWQVITGAWNMPDPNPSAPWARVESDTSNLSSDTGGPDGPLDVAFGLQPAALQPSGALGAVSEPGSPQLGRRRYAHLLPENAAAGIWTYTSQPLSAREILNSAFRGAWGAFAFNRSYPAEMSSVYPQGIDASSGVKLGDLVAQINEATGSDCTITGARNLEWIRKGSGLPVIVPTLNTSPRRVGRSLTSNDTSVMVTGDPNLVQVINLELEPDWRPSWEVFIDEAAWIREIVDVFQIDVSGKSGRAEAVARAREVTVAQYAKAKGDQGFADYRSFGKISRMSLPAWKYIRELVFRSYRIPPTYKWGGVPLDSLKVASGLLAATEIVGQGQSAKQRYRRDQLAWYPGVRAEAIVQGQPLDLIDGRSIELFMARRVKNLREEWTTQTDFEIDESSYSIRFRSPVFIDGSPDLDEALFSYVNKGQGGGVDFSAQKDPDSDYFDVVVPNPNAVILPARVRISIAWQLGVYRSTHGSGPRHGVMPVAGLGLHLLDVETDSGFSPAGLRAVSGNPAFLPEQQGLSLKEVLYENGNGALEASALAAETKTQLEEVQTKGSYTLLGSAGTNLSSVIDRVTLTISEKGVIAETVELTKARPSGAFFAESTLQRIQRIGELFPGQEALRREVERLRIESRLVDSSDRKPGSDTHAAVDDLRSQPIGGRYQGTVRYVFSASEAGPFAVGDVIWLGDSGAVAPDGQRFGGVAVLPSSGAGATDVVYAANDGLVPMRCAGGIPGGSIVQGVSGDPIGRASGDISLGRLEHATETPSSESGEVLAMVRLNSGSSGASQNCPFGEVISLTENDEPVTAVRGGVVYAGDTVWDVDHRSVDLAVDLEELIWIEVGVTANMEDEVLLPGLETSNAPEWKTGPPASGFPDIEVPGVPSATGKAVIAVGTLKVKEGVASLDGAGCGNIRITHCPGSLGHLRVS
jgi:hypothetical protein